MTIYLPPSYDTSDTRYPVVYLLHGTGCYEQTFFDGTTLIAGFTIPGLRVGEIADQLIATS
jgi:hypothetical protein